MLEEDDMNGKGIATGNTIPPTVNDHLKAAA
jgi:hypothetical protein